MIPEPPDSRLLAVTGLQVTVGDPPVEAVNGIEFEINRGEILGMAGESGSGKSVSAFSLTRLLPATARPRYRGEVRLQGVEGNLLELGTAALRRIRGPRIGYIFQEPSSSFNPVYTIESQLREVLRAAGLPKSDCQSRLHTALEEVGIEPSRANLEAYPGSYSGGMLQRMAIACALALKPDLLIADEPTTALDTSTQRRIVNLLTFLNREHGMAILFISHNLGLLKEIAANILVMREGRIVEAGPTGRILRSPQNPYTRGLIDSIPKLKLPAGSASPDQPGTG